MHSPSISLLNGNAPAWVGSTGAGERVALKTALAKVNVKRESKVRGLWTQVLIDLCFCQGSKKVKIETSKKGAVWYKGSVNAEYRIRDILEVALDSLSGHNCVKIECIIVGDIANMSNYHADTAKKIYSHHHSIWFSDVCRSNNALFC